MLDNLNKKLEQEDPLFYQNDFNHQLKKNKKKLTLKKFEKHVLYRKATN